jgi:hypothetical protein
MEEIRNSHNTVTRKAEGKDYFEGISGSIILKFIQDVML